MQNKGFVIFLTVVVTALCLFYLSFTVVSSKVQKDAAAYATDANGVFNFNKKQAYIDSVWNKPVYNFLGIEYTYKEVKDNELSLGLDLQGGMHVTLEVSPVDIIRSLSGNSQDSTFIKALRRAREMQRNSQESYTSLFFEAFRQIDPNKSLKDIFANATTRGRISINDSDDQVKAVINEEVESAIDRSYTILKNRIDQFGTSSPNIQRLPGTGRIQIEIPGADNPQRVRKLLQGVARLEFWDVMEPYTIQSSLIAINDILVKEKAANRESVLPSGDQQPSQNDLENALGGEKADTATSDLQKQLSTAADSAAKKGLDSLTTANTSPLLALSVPQGMFRYSLTDTAQINSIFRRPDIRNLLPRNVGIYWGNKTDQQDRESLTEEPRLQLYFLETGRSGKPKLTGEVISNARHELDQNGRYAISMTMNATGTKIWAKMTAEAANKQPRGRIAIVLDNTVYSAPYVQGEIPNGNSQISGDFTLEEAKDLANILKAGSLPAPTRIVEEAIVGPTLGQVAANQGLISVISGLALVVIFMVAYYSTGGLVADLALLFNVFFILGILAQPVFGTALTLPGIAGIVLTMGMAVDSNVLIYERIKEEMLHGRKLKDAIKTGYSKAFATILDSNLTTFIAGFFLFMLGQGPIKGFAITLMIGIITSVFSSVYISRVFVEWMTRRGDESKISFETALARIVRKRKHFEFIKHSRPAYMVSGAIILVGFILIFVQGLNLGVDFKGGRSYVVSFSQPVSATELRIDLSKEFQNTGTEVKNYGSNSIMKVTTSYLIDEESDEADDKVKQALISGIEKKFTGIKYTENEAQLDEKHFTIGSSSKVGATVADDIKKSAWKASLFSLIGIFVYILFRFRKWQYSMGAIIATIHDTLFVFASFAIARVLGISFEIDQVFVGAILAIIGYSINDTVIIFDRIREYLKLGTSHDRPKIFNDAINDTLSRTILTAGTTLLVVLVLLIFGGEVLRGFAFAFLIGIVVGTFSSIYIAAPVVLEMDNVEKKITKKAAPEPKKAIA
ncbi:MAG TPA: protein translocase subunit SecDF [Cyclobacteriaceae bacterium]|nr:protein translocase subunit SecDF [Cyclobacteriaceae bacterium]